MLAGRTGLPHYFEPYLTPIPLLVDGHFVHDKTQNALPVSRRRGGCAPNLRQILAQGLQRYAICLAQDDRFFRTPACIFLFNSFRGAQLVFPGSFERACHKSVFGLDSVVLPSCPFGLVAGAFASERPLPLKLSTLFLQLSHRRERDRNLVRSESVEENALDERVDRQCPDFLAQGAGSLVAIDPATIDWVVAIRPRITQGHATAAAATDCDALQQRRASARRARVPRLIPVDIVRHSPLVGHELLPADITRVGGLQANRPISDRHFDGSPRQTRSASARILLPTAIDIRPSIGRILKNIANPRTVGFTPDDIMRRRSEDRSDRQRQSARAQEAHDTACALQFPELGKDEQQTRLHFFIGIEGDRARAVISEPSRQRQAQF